MKYLVEVAIDGFYKVEVEAKSQKAAKEAVMKDFPSNNSKLEIWYTSWKIEESEASND
jgi:hypothetical protein